MQARAERFARQILTGWRRLAKRDRLTVRELDLLEFRDVLRDVQTISFFLTRDRRPLVLASPFEEELRELRRRFGTQLIDVNEAYDQRVLQTLQDLQTSINTKLTEALTAPVEEREDRIRRVLGTLNRVEADVKTNLRTASQLASNVAQYIEDRFGDSQALLWGYLYVTAADDRVRPNHAAMHGVTKPKEDPIWSIWWPPNGWNCRCRIVPLYSELSEVDPPAGVFPDEGWRFNPGRII